jgi:hypothetical protein
MQAAAVVQAWQAAQAALVVVELVEQILHKVLMDLLTPAEALVDHLHLTHITALAVDLEL